MPKLQPWAEKLLGSSVGGIGEVAKAPTKEIREIVFKQIEALPNLPDEQKAVLKDHIGSNPFSLLSFVWGLGTAMAMQSVFSMVGPFMAHGTYLTSKISKQFRLDPDTITKLWLRDFKIDGEPKEFWEDLKDAGWDDDRIAGAKELAHYLPSPTEIMTWAAREVFEPELREKYQLDKFLPPDFLKWAEKVGITGEVAKNYWAAHWMLPSLTAIQELWRRQILTKEDVDAFWTELDMVPWVREDLFKLFRAVPTRVDVRRFWDMRTIDEPRLRDIYKAQGYWEEDLEDYVMWTKVYVDFPDLMARYKNGWIPIEEVKRQLIEVDGMSEDRFKELLQTKIKAVQEERVAETTALTRSLIIKGAKDEKLTRDETIELLMLKNYNLWEAEYIYDVEVAAASSPETSMEFRKLVESYRKAVGLDFKEVPSEVLEADRKRSELRSALSQARSRKAPGDDIARLQADLEIAEIEVKQLKATYGL